MNRLTYKVNDHYYFDNIDELIDASNKLGKLEDIEEELGVDLITLFKCIEYGFYTKYNYYPSYCNTFDLETKLIKVNDCDEHFTLNFKDYGKTWALTREELENDK